jgi:tetratricopeptide (TPR) repeat protein
MRQFGSIHRFLVIAVGLTAFLPAVGCGTKKKPALTIEQRLTNAEKEKTPDRQAAALLKVAKSQFAANDEAGAKATAGKALEKVKGEGDANVFAPRLIDIAGFLAEIGDRKPAREALSLACGLVDTIEDPVRKAKLFAEAGAIYKANTDPKEAREMLLKASAAAENVEQRFRADALAAVALGYTRSGLADAASDVVDKLLEAAKTLEEPRAKAEALAAAAGVQAQTGKNKEAEKLLEEAEAAAKSITRAEGKAYALLAVGNARSATGNSKQALALLKEADKAADKVPEPGSQKKIVALVRSAITDLEKKQKK